LSAKDQRRQQGKHDYIHLFSPAFAPSTKDGGNQNLRSGVAYNTLGCLTCQAHHKQSILSPSRTVKLSAVTSGHAYLSTKTLRGFRFIGQSP
jgi:hypothetical protein